MSTAVATCPSQLCFPWMQSEPFSNRAKSRSGKGARNPEKQTIREQAAVASAPVAIHSGTISKVEVIANRTIATTAEAKPPILQEGMRVGQVRIGNVMLSLLKKYGITEQEISDVLATIAQENCQGLAS